VLKDCTSLDDYIVRHQVDGVLWKAEKLLAGLDNPIHRNEAIEKMAHTLALIPKLAVRDDYAKKIGKLYDISFPTFQKYINDHLVIHSRKEKVKAKAEVKKNKVRKLEGDPEKWPFFYPKLKTNRDGDEILTGIEIDKFKYIQLLISFGFVRY